MEVKNLRLVYTMGQAKGSLAMGGGVTETELGRPLHMLGAHHCQLAPYPRTSFSFRKL